MLCSSERHDIHIAYMLVHVLVATQGTDMLSNSLNKNVLVYACTCNHIRRKRTHNEI